MHFLPTMDSSSIIYIYIIYTPNLGWGIAVFVRERGQGRFRGSSGGAGGSTEGAGGAPRLLILGGAQHKGA